MNTILQKIMELGAMEDRACSEKERKLIINEAEVLYNKHLAELNLLNIPDVVQQSELLSGFKYWYDHLSVEEDNMYEGRYEEVYLATL